MRVSELAAEEDTLADRARCTRRPKIKKATQQVALFYSDE
jgi:hypothetical protein